MAKKVSENDIQNINQDWGLDTSNGLPFSGGAVQKFIKETLNSKMGYFHYDVASNRYIVFANEESKNKYLEDPTQTQLILGSFDAPFNYEASINMVTPSYNAIFLGSEGNYLDYTFDIVNKQGASTGENVVVVYTFIRNGVKQTVTETRRYGEAVHFNIDKYLLEGTNTIIIGITGQNTYAATTTSVTYQVVNLQFSDNIDISKSYDITEGSKTMEVFFSISGYGTKTIEWFLDGEQLDFVKAEDEIVDTSSQRTKYIELANLIPGIHTIQSRAYTVVNGEKFYTDINYREIIVTTEGYSDNVVAVATTIPNTYGVITEDNPLTFHGVEQYLPYEVRFATYRSGNVSIHLGDDLLATIASSAGVENLYSISTSASGTLNLKFTVDGKEREVPVYVNPTSLKIEELTNGLTFDFRALGRSNSAIDKDQWSYEGYTGELKGFKWNPLSGWVNNGLLVSTGAEFNVDYAPLAADATETGATFEFEFSTANVEDDDAVICDLTTNGVGILITASEAKLTSAAGAEVSTKYKAGEVHRISFVINRRQGVTYKGLAFIYVDGVISGAVNYGTADNFVSDKTLSFVGTENANISLRGVRCYTNALTKDNMVNNFTLYRDTLSEMLAVYYRNQVYEEGTERFSPEALLQYVPVMIITGDVPVLEAATSTSVQILVDIEFRNAQDPTKNFIMKNVVLRIQGTSSLAYPRKNFDIFTRKEESSIIYDYQGNVITDKLYAFKDKAQPVDCWNLKADFAESSGTHNTGIARIWNDAMYGAIIQHTNILGEEVNGYALRTQAQQAALNAGYDYDVRTTVDGFPIALFYKKSENDTDLIFLGKYNFNNSKRTPNVFGFEGIPGFDNSRMQCWETKDNGHPLGLFTDVSQFDENWSEAFESRYPDTDNPNTADLKAFSVWLNGVSQEDFATQKWEHFDVYKVAAYYVYLMRFGAVDQPVKNAFITSENGRNFFFINYDNDTTNGLINTGRLVLDPDVDRDTIGADGEYVYAGHNSVLWNKFTADEEFMQIVPIVDNALYMAGLRYDNVIKIFNEEQAAKWVERVYNQDAEYKYLMPYVNQATNNLFMLQGARTSHRSWWLSKRFALYDALFVSGAYRDKNISFKCLNDTQPGQEFTIVSGNTMNYGYGINNGLRDTGINLEKGARHTFTTRDTLNLGDVVKIFAAANLQELDLSMMADRLAVLECTSAADAVIGTKMKKLILGGNNKTNTELADISGIKVLDRLQELNIELFKGMTSIDLTNQYDFRKLYAKGSNLSSIDFAPGAPVDTLQLPASMLALNFTQLPNLTLDGLTFESGLANVHTVNITGCPNLTNNFTIVQQWLNDKTTDDKYCTLVMDNVAWDNMDYQELIKIANIGNLSLKGYAKLTEASEEIVNAIIDAFGEEVFNADNDFFVDAPASIFIIGPSEVLKGDTAKYSAVVFPATLEGTLRWNASGTLTGITFDEETEILTTTENSSSNQSVTLGAIYVTSNGNIVATKSITVANRTYPSSSQLSLQGAVNISSKEFYQLKSSIEYNGIVVTNWTLTGDITTVANLTVITGNEAKIELTEEVGAPVSGTLSVVVAKDWNSSTITTLTMTVYAVNENIAETDPGICQALYNAGLCANSSYITKDEAKLVLASDIATIFKNNNNIKSFDGFQYFTSVTDIPASTFDNCKYLQSIKFPNSILTVGGSAFYYCERLNYIYLNNGLTEIVSYAFQNCRKIKYINIPSTITTIGKDAFLCTSPGAYNDWDTEVHIDSLESWCNIDFALRTSNPLIYSKGIYINGELVRDIIIPDGVETIKLYAFFNQSNIIDSVTIPSSVSVIKAYAFYVDSVYDGPTPNKINIYGKEYKLKSLGYFAVNYKYVGYIDNAITGWGVYYHNYRNVYPTKASVTYELSQGCCLYFGSNSFSINAGIGYYFDNKTAEKTIDLQWTGGVEDLTERLKISYIKVTINSNMSDAQFKISYTNFDGVEEETTVGVGTHILPVDSTKIYTITGVTEYEGYNAPSYSGRISSLSSINQTLNYEEITDLFIAHKDGNLYTKEEWTSGGYSNDDAEGIAIARYINGTIIMSKEDIGNYKWGTYMLYVDNLIKDGYYNTNLLIKEYSDYIDYYSTVGVPAASAAYSYLFPSGTHGYLPLLDDIKLFNWYAGASNLLTIIGGTWFAVNSYYTTSNQTDNSYITTFRTDINSSYSNSKNNKYPVRPFSQYHINITSNKASTFTLEYTDIWDNQITKTVEAGVHKLNIKQGCTMKITPAELDGLSAEPMEFTWSGFQKDVNFVYSRSPGVYIQHVDGSLYTGDEWTAEGFANDVGNSIVIISSEAQFGLPMFNLSFGGGVWSTVTNQKLTSSSINNISDALNDYNAYKYNNEIIMSMVSCPAVSACINYTFPDGSNGAMPTAAHCSLINSNINKIEEINEALGINFYNWNCWTCSEINESSVYYWAGGTTFNSTNKNTSNRILPILLL